MYMDPVKPFAFMIISLFLGALPFTALNVTTLPDDLNAGAS